MLATGTRMACPWLAVNIKWSDSSTGNEATTAPLSTLEGADTGQREANALAGLRRQQNVVLVSANLHAHNAVAGRQLHGDLAVAIDAGEVRKFVAPHVARFRGEDDVEFFPLRLVFGQRQDGGDFFALRERQEDVHRLVLAFE